MGKRRDSGFNERFLHVINFKNYEKISQLQESVLFGKILVKLVRSVAFIDDFKNSRGNDKFYLKRINSTVF